MLHAVAQRLAPHAELVASSTFGVERLPARPHVLRVVHRAAPAEVVAAARAGSRRGALTALARVVGPPLIPRPALNRLGYVDGRDLTGLVDCSGFAYGDQWSAWRLRDRAQYFEQLKSRGVRLVMLPQALGPFDDPEMRMAADRLFRCFDLVCPRDDTSMEHARGIGIPEDLLHQAPDITHVLSVPPPADAGDWSRRVCVVPSARMLDRTASPVGEGYVAYLVDVLRRICAAELEPWLVLHEANDRALLDEVQKGFGRTVPVLDRDGLHTKGVLGVCRAVVGSRYHALVSAMSQGTPTLGMSWSHKYEALFAEYGVREFLVAPSPGDADSQARLDQLLDPSGEAELRTRLQAGARAQAEQVQQMWRRAEAVLSG